MSVKLSTALGGRPLALAALCMCASLPTQGQTRQMAVIPVTKDWPIQEPPGSRLLDVSKENPHWDLVTEELQKIKRVPENALYEVLMHGKPKEIRGKAIGKLFSEHRFYVFAFSHKSTSPQMVGLCYGMHYTIAGGKNGSVFRLNGMSTCDSFGEFLTQQNVKIENAADARLVADAYSEIFRQPRAVSISYVSDRQWRFFVPTAQTGVRRDVLVHLDEDSTVRSTEYRTVSSRRENNAAAKRSGSSQED